MRPSFAVIPAGESRSGARPSLASRWWRLLSSVPPIVKYHLADRDRGGDRGRSDHSRAGWPSDGRATPEAIAVRVSTETDRPVAPVATSRATEPAPTATAEAPGSRWSTRSGSWVSVDLADRCLRLDRPADCGELEPGPAGPAVGGCPRRDRRRMSSHRRATRLFPSGPGPPVVGGPDPLPDRTLAPRAPACRSGRARTSKTTTCGRSSPTS